MRRADDGGPSEPPVGYGEGEVPRLVLKSSTNKTRGSPLAGCWVELTRKEDGRLAVILCSPMGGRAEIGWFYFEEGGTIWFLEELQKEQAETTAWLEHMETEGR